MKILFVGGPWNGQVAEVADIGTPKWDSLFKGGFGDNSQTFDVQGVVYRPLAVRYRSAEHKLSEFLVMAAPEVSPYEADLMIDGHVFRAQEIIKWWETCVSGRSADDELPQLAGDPSRFPLGSRFDSGIH